MIVGCIIPTLNERPRLTEFVINRINQQTRKPDITLIIDYPNLNGSPDIAKRYKEGINILIGQKVDLIAFIEDDDYYPVTYIEELLGHWKANGMPDLIGCKQTIYYHILRLQYLIVAPKHSSAFCTAVGENVLWDVCDDYEAYYDVKLWKANKGVQVEFKNPPIGIKHGIGRCGGGGHHNDKWYQTSDEDLSYLEKMMDPEAFEFYKSMI